MRWYRRFRAPGPIRNPGEMGHLGEREDRGHQGCVGLVCSGGVVQPWFTKTDDKPGCVGEDGADIHHSKHGQDLLYLSGELSRLT
jgi:hypothetical protein